MSYLFYLKIKEKSTPSGDTFPQAKKPPILPYLMSSAEGLSYKIDAA
jgi:hypothetical protein